MHPTVQPSVHPPVHPPVHPMQLALAEARLAYIDDDELVEVTPLSIRLRKRYLDLHERKKNARRAEAG